MSKKITFDLSVNGINRAIRELEQYKVDFQKNVDTYRKRIADEIAAQVTRNFGSAIVDDVIGGSPRKAEVTIDVTDSGQTTVVIANGEDAIWCEFGAGVTHNGSAGASPNPLGSELGFTIGSYGQGKGKQKAWGYYPDNDKSQGVVITRGTPATMPMYNALQDVASNVVKIAREVFR